MDIIYYHGGCPDGWCAAMVAHMKYREAQLIPLSYGAVDYEAMLYEVAGKDVLMLDFSMKTAKECDGLYYTSHSFHIYDHHKSAQKIIGDKGYATFDMERSGAGLTFDYLYGKDSDYHKQVSIYNPMGREDMPSMPRPWYVDYTEDQDLWRFRLPMSRYVNNWLNVQRRDPKLWWYQIAQNTAETVKPLGVAIQDQIDYMVRHAVKDLLVGKWVQHSVGVVNNGHIGTSEVGEAIYNLGYDIALLWREDGHGMMRFGLRSTKVDVGAIAATFPGGGGHVAAAGFEMSIEEGRALLDSILGRDQDGEQTSRSC